MPILYAVLTWLLSNAARLILTSLAVALVTSSVILVAFNAYVDEFLSMSGSIDSSVMGIAALAGVHIALAMVLGALTYKVTLKSLMPRFIKR